MPARQHRTSGRVRPAVARRAVALLAAAVVATSCGPQPPQDETLPPLTVAGPRVPGEVGSQGANLVASGSPIAGAQQSAGGTNFDSMSSIRAAFYSSAYPESWHTPTLAAATNFHPDHGSYSSVDPVILQRHLDEMAYAHVDVAIASWWGSGSVTATRFDALLGASARSAIRWSIHYEPESEGDPSADEIVRDLRPLVAAHAADPRLFRLDGRFVVFVANDAAEHCDLTARWLAAADTLGIYVVAEAFDGFATCPAQPDAWHQYAPTTPEQAVMPWSYTVSPGFWRYGDTPRLGRDPGAFMQAVNRMVLAHPKLQLVATFNEWGDGSAVEPAAEWQTDTGYGVYLDILHGIPPRP